MLTRLKHFTGKEKKSETFSLLYPQQHENMKRWKLVLLCSIHSFNIKLSFVGTNITEFNSKYYCVWNCCHMTKWALCLIARNIAISYNLSLNFRNLQKVRNNFALFYICVYAPSKSRLFYFVYMKRLYCWWGSSVRSIRHLSRDRPLSCHTC